MPTNEGKSGEMQPVRSPPDVCGDSADRQINLDNPSLALADPWNLDNSSAAKINFSASTYIAPGSFLPTPKLEKPKKRKSRRRRTTNGNLDDGSKKTRRCSQPCCGCTRSSTCGRMPTEKQAGCSCVEAGRKCTSCDCYDSCRNRSRITAATGSLAAYFPANAETTTTPPHTDITPDDDDGEDVLLSQPPWTPPSIAEATTATTDDDAKNTTIPPPPPRMVFGTSQGAARAPAAGGALVLRAPPTTPAGAPGGGALVVLCGEIAEEVAEGGQPSPTAIAGGAATAVTAGGRPGGAQAP